MVASGSVTEDANFEPISPVTTELGHDTGLIRCFETKRKGNPPCWMPLSLIYYVRAFRGNPYSVWIVEVVLVAKSGVLGRWPIPTEPTSAGGGPGIDFVLHVRQKRLSHPDVDGINVALLVRPLPQLSLEPLPFASDWPVPLRC